MSYDYWCDKVFENNCTFGIVKTAHKSKLGDVQKMSYQMINTLEMDIMPNVVKRSKDYIELLKKDDNVFLQYLKDNVNLPLQILYLSIESKATLRNNSNSIAATVSDFL